MQAQQFLRTLFARKQVVVKASRIVRAILAAQSAPLTEMARVMPGSLAARYKEIQRFSRSPGGDLLQVTARNIPCALLEVQLQNPVFAEPARQEVGAATHHAVVHPYPERETGCGPSMAMESPITLNRLKTPTMPIS